MSAWFRQALTRLAARRGRTVLALAGVFAASALAGTCVTVSYGLATGFDRAAERADLPDVVARFADLSADEVEPRIESLPNVESRTYRLELTDRTLTAAGGSAFDGVVHLVEGGRRGYAVVEGRDLSGAPGEVVVERGVAEQWRLSPGDRLDVEGFGPLEVVGVAVGPDDVAYPLASNPRVYVARQSASTATGADRTVNVALLWAEDPTRLDPLLVQARAVSFGIEELRFVTRAGIRTLVDQAAGIVIVLLTGFCVVALVAAGAMLGMSARAEVQRRLESIGVMRAVGFSRLGVALRYAGDAVLVALPAGVIGLGAGAYVAARPSADLLESLNEFAPGSALLAPLAGTLVAIVGLVVVATAWPAWRAAARPPAATLRGGDVRAAPQWLRRTPSGAFGLGLRLAAARPGRTIGTTVVVATAAAVVLLMLGLASFLERLEEDPGALGKQYDLTTSLAPTQASEVEELRGVAAAAPRYAVDAASAFSLGQPLRLIAFPGDHTTFEAPPLSEGRRLDGPREAEVGVGLATALGLEPGGTLAVTLPSGAEARFRVVGLVQAIENEGRVAYVRPPRLLAAATPPSSTIAVRLTEDADPDAVASELAGLGDPAPDPASGLAPRDDRAFLGTLADVLRVVAAVNLLICLYALVQALALTVVERRQVIAVLRSGGARRATVARVLLGAALAVVAAAAPVAVVLDAAVLSPATARFAAGIADLPIGVGPGHVAVVTILLVLLAASAAAWVARRVEREPVAAALREA